MATDISVILPCYNAELTIGRAVRSALENQAHLLKVDCVVCDDGSTDTSATVAEACGATVIRQANAGPSAALNVALANATGRYVICLAADDWLESDCLIHLFNAMVDASLEGKAVFVAGATRYHGRKNTVMMPQAKPDFTAHNATLYGFLYAREVIAKGVQYHTFKAGYGLEDWDFALQLTEKGYSPLVIEQLVLNHVYTGNGLHGKTLERSKLFMDELRERHPQVKAEATL